MIAKPSIESHKLVLMVFVRGLDVHPKTYRRFLNGGDQETAKLLEVLYKDEITHVAAGIKWFSYLCENTVPPLVRTYCLKKCLNQYSMKTLKLFLPFRIKFLFFMSWLENTSGKKGPYFSM